MPPGCVRCKVHSDPIEIAGHTEPSERDPREDLGSEGFGIDDGFSHARLHIPGSNRVRPDPILAVLDCDPLDHRANAGLRRCVMLPPGKTEVCRHGRRDDQRPAMSRFHVFDGLSERPEHTFHVDGKDVPPLLGGHVLESCHSRPDASVGEDRINVTERIDSCGERIDDFCFIRDINSQCQYLTAVRADHVGGVRVPRFRPSPDGYVRAGLAESARHCEADAVVATGHEGDLACEIEEVVHGQCLLESKPSVHSRGTTDASCHHFSASCYTVEACVHR